MVILIHFGGLYQVQFGFKAIFVWGGLNFTEGKSVAKCNDAKWREFYLAIKTLFAFEKGWGKFPIATH